MFHDEIFETRPAPLAPTFTRKQLMIRRVLLILLAPVALATLVMGEFGESFMFFIRGVKVEFRKYRKVVRCIWNGESYDGHI